MLQSYRATPTIQRVKFKGRYGRGNKGNFESGQNNSKVCSYILKYRECTPLVVTLDTSSKQCFKRDNILQLRISISLVDCQLPCPPLNSCLRFIVKTPVTQRIKFKPMLQSYRKLTFKGAQISITRSTVYSTWYKFIEFCAKQVTIAGHSCFGGTAQNVTTVCVGKAVYVAGIEQSRCHFLVRNPYLCLISFLYPRYK